MDFLNTYFSPKNPYRFVVFLPLVFLAAVIGCIVLFSFSAANKSSMPDSNWTISLEMALKNIGADVRKIQIIDKRPEDGEREITISVGDKERTTGESLNPRMLVGSVQIEAAAFFYKKSPPPVMVAWITIKVFQENTELYTVSVKPEYVRQLIDGEINEDDFVKTWEISGNAPDFASPSK